MDIERRLLERANEMDTRQRVYPAEFRADEDGARIAGHIAVFNSLSEDLGGFREIIRPGAFAKTLQEADIRALFNHDSNFVLGRNKSGTLTVSEDERGLYIEVDVPDTAWARDLLVSMRRGDIDQGSFAFRTVKDDWKERDGQLIRELAEVRLYDVSVVTYPAYPATSAYVRSDEDEPRTPHSLEIERKRLSLKLKE